MEGCLYFCATPIGNLDDITLRVLDVLRNADLIVAEDTRHTRKLLSHFDIHKPLLSCHDHNEADRIATILDRVAAGQRVAVVSDAGMPAVSDPGALLAAAATERGLPWTVLPGPSAVLTGLVRSGFGGSPFAFLGFPPRKKGERRTWLNTYALWPITLVFFEAPHRIAALLEDLLTVFGSRPAALVRELTKRYEEVEQGDLGELVALYREKTAKGEYVVVVAGATVETTGLSLQEALEEVEELVAGGQEPAQAIRQVSSVAECSRRELYNAYHQKLQSAKMDPLAEKREVDREQN